MGVSSDAPGKPFQAPPAVGAGSGVMLGNNPNIRGMANGAAQSVASRQQQFMNMVDGSSQATPNNYSSEIQKLTSLRAAPDEDYIKAGALLVERRDEVDAFIDWVLFGK